eukprot:TRINITY_DN4937_c0_g1_i8.p1 TRINITY_DN4937_c0_g1~~TRINITY_DN4937_c0_g1_i8.p1  ORF type:complete len:105 (+),score=9.59 TRINITY_DN4937_c0_g1_i8:60-374(+)
MEPWVWSMDVKADILCQQNGSDCSVFTCAFVEHYIFRRPVRFTQADMPYFRPRILIEISKRSWKLNGNRLNLPRWQGIWCITFIDIEIGCNSVTLEYMIGMVVF